MFKSSKDDFHCDSNAKVYGPIFADFKDCSEVSLRQIKEKAIRKLNTGQRSHILMTYLG